MKKIFSILFALLLVACLGLLTQAPDGTGGPAYAAGAQPMALAGIASTITPAGPVPAGTLVQAYVGTELRAETTTEAEGLYRNLLVPGPGGTVTFRVAGVLAQESIAWESGEIMDDFDLTIPALPSAGYSLTMAVSPAGTGTATDVTGASPYAAGEVVSIQAVAVPGYQFAGWTAPAGLLANAYAAATTFTMPAQDITVTAIFAVAGPTTWYVVEGGAGTRDGSNWDNAFATIQEAIDEAVPGDTIEVAAGEYDAFVVQEKERISIISTEGATVTTANLIQAVPVVGNAWVMAAVYDSEDVNIEGINFDGTGVSGKPVAVGIAYVDSTGRIADLTVENVIATELGAGVAIIGDRDTSTVDITGATISNNDDAGIYVCGGSTLEAHLNNIAGNTECGVLNDGGETADTLDNWWGDASGPLHQTNPFGRGNAVIGDVDFEPWLEIGVVGVVIKTVTDGGTVDAIDEADIEVLVSSTATVTVVGYPDNPHPSGSAPTDLNPLHKYGDVRVDDATDVHKVEIRLYYTDDEVAKADVDDESLLQLLWWDGDDWKECSDSGVNTANTNINGIDYSGYMWAEIRETGTTPTLSQLTGTPFGGYGHPTETDGCFIATAAYGTDTAKEIDILREFRDAVLLPNSLGAEFVSLYYKISPPIANFISQHEVLRTAVRVAFVDPIVKILNWSHALWSARG